MLAKFADLIVFQVLLLKAMVGPETSLVVVGDVDQAIYGFRGADEAGIRNFKSEFSPLFNGKFEDVVLKNCRRFGSTIRSAASIVIGDRIPVGFDRDDILAHRNPSVDQQLKDDLSIRTFDSAGAEAANIADQIARAHAHDGFAWSEMAVIVRSAKVSLPTIHRALVSAGIPVTVASDELPLHLDPAVSPLLDALKAIDNQRALTAELAHDLLTGPLASVDQVDLRRLAAALRREQRKANETVLPSGQLIAKALAKPGTIAHIEDEQLRQVVLAVSELGNLIEVARTKMKKGATPHELLDFVWQQSHWKDRLEQKALSFEFSSHSANRDLDAICALFDLANRFVARGGGKDLTIFLNEIQSQVIPAESLAENDTRSDSVRLLTAHRAKGLQWPMVIVAGVQEDLWPDLRSRQTILQADRIGPNEVLMPPTFSETMASERRLFYVAVTRAMHKLVITAVDTTLNDENGTAPSRFLLELKDKSALLDWHHIGGRPKRPLSADGLIANLRQVLLSESTSPALKQAAAFRLAALAKRNVASFKHANPKNWWGINEITQNKLPDYLSLSPSTIGDIEKCALRYFLERQAGAVSDSAANLVFGNILHLIAEGLANGQIESDIEAIDKKIDHIWPDDAYGAKWESNGERREAHIASVRLLNWFMEHGNAETLTEVNLNTKTKVIDPEGNEFTISINGKADRIEFELDGITIYDFKTSKSVVSKKELAENVQLALYSYLLENGTFNDGDKIRSLVEGQKVSGAALVQLRAGVEDQPTVQELKAGAHDENSEVPLIDRINHAAIRIIGNQFEATNEENNCRTCKVKILCPIQPEGRKVQL